MDTKSKFGTVQLSQTAFGYVGTDGKLWHRVLPDNVPRIVGKRNKGDEKFLSTNKLHLLQRFFKA